MKSILFIAVITAMLQLVGCATHVQPQAPTIERPIPNNKPDVEQPDKPRNTSALPPSPSQPQTKAPLPVSNAVVSLVAQARGQYQAKNYAAAIATAERGLRIDRRSPELYLLLAQSYVQLANSALAQQFAQQGIRYAQAGTEVAQSLLKVRDSLSN